MMLYLFNIITSYIMFASTIVLDVLYSNLNNNFFCWYGIIIITHMDDKGQVPLPK